MGSILNSLSNELQRKIVSICAIGCEAIGQTKLIEIINRFSYPKYKKEDVVAEVQLLVKDKKLELLAKGYAVRQAIHIQVLTEVIETENWEKIAGVIREILPVYTYSYSYYRSYAPRTWEVLEREYLLSFLTFDNEKLSQIYESCQYQRREDLLAKFEKKYRDNFKENSSLYRHYHPEILKELINSWVIEDFTNGHGISSIQAFLNEIKQSLNNTTLAYLGLFEGKKVTNEVEHFNFIFPIQKGNYDEANRLLDAFLKTLKKADKAKSFQTIAGIFQTVFSLKERKNFDFLDKVFSDKTDFQNLEVEFQTLKRFYQFQKNIISKPSTELRILSLTNLTLRTLVWGWVSYWMNDTTLQPAEASTLLRKIEERMAQGYHWLAFEAATIGFLLTEEQTLKDRFENLKNNLENEHGFVSIATFFYIKEDWERFLEALITVSGDTKASVTKELKESRVAWIIHPDKPELLQPIEQKLSKNGKWSAGKNIALKRLQEGNVENLLEQDRKAIKKYELEEFYSGYGYYSKQEYVPTTACFKALVGHPYLFLHGSNAAIELVERNVELIVDKSGKDYSVSFNYSFKDTGVQLVKETPTRYAVIEITQKLVELKRVFGKEKVKVPEKGEKALLESLKRLSNVVSVQTALVEDTADLPVVEANNQIYAHVLPMGEGFKLELFVKPSEKLNQYYKPTKGAANLLTDANGLKMRVSRNLKIEKKNLEALLELCPNLNENVTDTLEWHFEDQHACLEILNELTVPREKGLVILEWPKGERFRVKRQVDFKNLHLKVSRNNDWFGLEGEIQVDDNLTLTIQELLKAIRKNKSQFIEITDGQFLSLSKQLRKRLDELNAFLHEDKKGLRFNNLASLAVDDLLQEAGKVKTDSHWKKNLEKIKEAQAYKPQLPSTLQTELRPYQLEGFHWLSQLAHWGVGACLADDMGLGKTIQSMAVLLDRAANGPALVVAPLSVSFNWEAEIHKFAPTLRPIVYARTDRKNALVSLQSFDVVIVTYGLLQSDIEEFKKIHFSTIILDEAQAIKNISAKRTQAAFDLNGDFKLITTGTPIENHLGELWSIFNFINPGLLGSLNQFNEKFLYSIEKDNDLERKKILKKLIQPFILRRKKTEVLDELPSKTEITLKVELTKEERAFYEALRQNAIEELEGVSENELKEKRFQVLAEITKLRQASCHPAMVDDKLASSSSKLELLDETLDELIENNHKVLIFSQFVKHLRLIEERVKKKKISYHYLDGQRPLDQRQKMVNEFQQGKGDVFLISLKAGGAGLNLTAADYVIHMDPWWNPAVEDQASDRAHRIGQQRPVTVYRIIAKDTIEEKIIALHATKKDLADSLLEGTDASGKLSVNELIELMRQ